MTATIRKRLGKWATRVDDAEKDEDGVWIYLKDGWQDSTNPTCHTIHEDTWKDAIAVLKATEPCSCKGCIALAAGRS